MNDCDGGTGVDDGVCRLVVNVKLDVNWTRRH